jgi:anti-sigma factor RsiW
MTCVSPPELTDAQFLAYLDGQAAREVEAHVKQCPHCRERMNRLAGFQSRLTSQLYRLTCPSPAELGEYHLGILPDARKETVRRHLTECPHCSQELAQLVTYLGKLAPDVEFSLREKVKVLAAQLIGGDMREERPGPLVMLPVGLGVRGEQGAVRVYQAEGIQIVVETQSDPHTPGRQVLLGLITGTDISGWKADLWQDKQLVATTPVDELGNLYLTGLSSGQYELVLTGADVEIHLSAVQV